ncbi:N-acetylmuramic acid 6-phosphate etherase [Jiangella anatolica]|uniref:N-acetylmuramic acid 6-phosphate etherase n=1 Tax=Jiangella anatolica TaxID=2670374 RepID=A0A2W2CNG3_9ACTN|nr:N-acetylmuramic acid 6-phosphate etherase [Jiangella anatolica]PZF86736.1 N-acetylmuramic acid 6-phosphate etherase [Jiangella anatolica]
MATDTSEPARLATEARSEATHDIDLISVEDGLVLLAGEFRRSFDAFQGAAAELAPVVYAVVGSLRRGNTVHLFGAGTSGRLAALDAAEIPPTFGLAPELFTVHLAGGAAALTTAVEDAEDDRDEGARAGGRVRPGDVAIGVTASGRTPYVLAALDAAGGRGAYTALIACNPPEPSAVDCVVTLPTGPEPIAGSTRLNAATAQKLALNAVSTLAMVHLGRTYSNLMVCLQPNNTKVRQRQFQLLSDLTGAPAPEVEAALVAADGAGGVALAMLLRGWDRDRAQRALDRGTPLRPLVGE